MVTNGEKEKTAEQIEQEFPSFVNQLKWTLITDKLAQDNNIEVKPDEIMDFARNQLLGYMGEGNIDINQPWIRDYLDRMMKDKKFVEDSFHRIRTDKLFAWAEGQAHPNEVPISGEEFTKMQQEHKHHHH
jgi:trigger factor